MLITKLLTERPRDHFDSAAIILDSFDEVDLNRFSKICQEPYLEHYNELRLRRIGVEGPPGYR